MKEMKEKDDKKTSKALVPILIGAITLAIGCVVTVLLFFNNPQKRMETKLNQAEQFLNEQKYEQAILTYQEIISENADCEEAYTGITEVYKTQAANSLTVEEAMNIYKEAENNIENFQYSEADLEVLALVASGDIKNAYVVLDFMDALKEEDSEVLIPKEVYINLAVQYMEEVGGKSVYSKYSEKVYAMDQDNLYGIYYGCIADYMEYEGGKINPFQDIDAQYPLSEAMRIMGAQESNHCTVKYDINILADGEQKDARICAFVYNEHGDEVYASWVGNIVYQDDAYDVYYTYDERGKVLSMDAAGYTWGGGDHETLEAKYSYRENGQLEKVMVNGSVYQEYRYDESDRVVYAYDNSSHEGAKTWYTYHEAEGYVDCRTEYIPIDWDDDGVYEERLYHCGAIVQNTVLEDGTEINVVADKPSSTGEVIIILPDGNRLNMWSAPVDGIFTVEHTEGEFVSQNAIAPGYAGDTYVVSVSDATGKLLYVYTYEYDEYGLLSKYRLEEATANGELRLYGELCYLTEVAEDEQYILRVEMQNYSNSPDKMNVRFGETCEIIYFKE